MTTTQEARAVCEVCGGKSRWKPIRDGRLSVMDLPSGWSVAPFSPEFVHADGTHGSKFVCPKCVNVKRYMAAVGVEGTEFRKATS